MWFTPSSTACAQYRDRLVTVAGDGPGRERRAALRQAHRAEPDPVDPQVTERPVPPAAAPPVSPATAGVCHTPGSAGAGRPGTRRRRGNLVPVHRRFRMHGGFCRDDVRTCLALMSWSAWAARLAGITVKPGSIRYAVRRFRMSLDIREEALLPPPRCLTCHRPDRLRGRPGAGGQAPRWRPGRDVTDRDHRHRSVRQGLRRARRSGAAVLAGTL